MKKLSGVVFVLAAGMSGLGLMGCAAGTTASGTKGGTPIVRLRGPIETLAMDGSRVAFSKQVGRPNGVLVWNLRTGKMTRVGGRQTAIGLAGPLAIAGSRVAWLSKTGGNTFGGEYLFTSSVARPKQQRVATAIRDGVVCGAGASGPKACAGNWLGGVVASGNRILVNRWTTNHTESIARGGLYALNGTRFDPVAIGDGTVEAVAADPKRVAVLHPDGTIGLYSTTGTSLFSITPRAHAEEVAVSGRNLVVLERHGKLALYDARTGSLRRTFTLYGNPDLLLGRALAVQGNIAAYSTPTHLSNGGAAVSESAIRTLNLGSGKDRTVGRLAGQITLARIDSFGLVYANSANGWGRSEVVFLPFKQVAAAVS
jgi:hypothetical protein